MKPQVFLNRDFWYAVVGASKNPEKYGYKVLLDFARAGLRAVGVNPKYREIEGLKCFPNLSAVAPKPDVAIFVVPPIIGLNIVDEAYKLGITKLWFQPGAESAALIAKAKRLEMTINTRGSCIIVARQRMFRKSLW
ncbi:CoA-binding protein [Candidatus Parcubacteria bacterium]|jgi:predicted CoA-binding protein|nr:MAG: CoA-binding protein [Candidatus Parcubacteria bacterium]